MTRGVATEIITALSADQISPFFAVELLFDDEDDTRFDEVGYAGNRAVRLWTGYQERTIDGEIYTGAGSLLGISRMEEAADLSAKGMSVTLAGEVASLVSLALQEPYQNRKARILFGVTNISDYIAVEYQESGTLPDLVFDFISDVYDIKEDSEVGLLSEDAYFVEVFSGIIDTMPIKTGPTSASITLTIESKYVSLQRAKVRRYTKENHQSRFPGDTFFDYTQSLADKEIAWGRKING